MKKIITLIITFIIFFSSLYNVSAEEGYIDKLLDLNYGIEKAELDLSNINYIHFNNEKYNKMYNELKTPDKILREQFIKKYRNGEYEYYQINGIITNYNNFIYHTNQFFYFLRLKELKPNYKETDTAIMNSYRNMRSSYNKVKNIVKGY